MAVDQMVTIGLMDYRGGSLRALLSLVLLASCSGCSEGSKTLVLRSADVTSRSREYRLGNSSVRVMEHRKDGPEDLLFFNMHDDENTAVEAALNVIARRGGRLVELIHSGRRLIYFGLDQTHFIFDPNRMFTNAGAGESLHNGGSFSELALQEIRTLAKRILEGLDLGDNRLILTVHNNTEGAYSTLSYLPEGEYSKDAELAYLAPDSDPDDFFFVTTRNYFEFFRQEGSSVVLQDNQTATDDGSLSVLAAAREVPYVNIEAQHGHLDQQIHMIEQVYRAFSEIQGK